MHDGEAETNGGQSGADVRGHVVVALAGVAEEGVAGGHEAGEEAFEIATDFGIGVFLNEQRRGGVAQMEREQAGLDGVVADEAADLGGHFVKALAAGGDAEFLGELAEHAGGRRADGTATRRMGRWAGGAGPREVTAGRA